MIKKFIVVFVIVGFLTTGIVRAQTGDLTVIYNNLLRQLIQLLMQEVQQLEQQLAELQASQTALQSQVSAMQSSASSVPSVPSTTPEFTPSQTLNQIQQVAPQVVQTETPPMSTVSPEQEALNQSRIILESECRESRFRENTVSFWYLYYKRGCDKVLGDWVYVQSVSFGNEMGHKTLKMIDGKENDSCTIDRIISFSTVTIPVSCRDGAPLKVE